MYNLKKTINYEKQRYCTVRTAKMVGWFMCLVVGLAYFTVLYHSRIQVQMIDGS